MSALEQTQQLTVFISYSRRDLDIADCLVDALAQHGFNVLIDRRDLPYGEEWQGELEDFIRQSDTVLWLVSPDSVESDWCNWEVGLVGDLKKRLIPIKIRNLDLSRIPKAIGKIHLMPAEGLFKLEPHLQVLIETLNTDRTWLKDATRFADRARQWLAKKRDGGLLLRGAALKDAEIWERQQPPNSPTPASEVLELILASRQAATRRLSYWLGGLSIVAASAIGLATYATSQTEIAKLRKEEAVGRYFGSEALLLLTNNEPGTPQVQLGTQLALQSWLRYPTEVGYNALKTALQKSLALLHIEPNFSFVEHGAINNKGTIVSLFRDNHHLILRSNPETLTDKASKVQSQKGMAQRLEGWRILEFHPRRPEAIAISNDGKTRYLNIKTGSARAFPIPLAEDLDIIDQIEYSFTGRYITLRVNREAKVYDTLTRKFTKQIFNVSDGSKLLHATFDEKNMKLNALSWSSETLRATEIDQAGNEKELMTAQVKYEPPSGVIDLRSRNAYLISSGLLSSVGISEDVAGNQVKDVCILDIELEACGKITGEKVALNRKRPLIAVADGSRVTIYSTDEGEPVGTIDIGWSKGQAGEVQGINTLKFSNNGRYLLITSEQGVSLVSDLGLTDNQFVTEASPKLNYPDQAPYRSWVRLAPNATSVFIKFPTGWEMHSLAAGTGQLFRPWDELDRGSPMNTGLPRHPTPSDIDRSNLVDLADAFYSHDGRKLNLVSNVGGLRTIQLSKRRPIQEKELLPNDSAYCCGVYISKERKFFFSSVDGKVGVFDESDYQARILADASPHLDVSQSGGGKVWSITPVLIKDAVVLRTSAGIVFVNIVDGRSQLLDGQFRDVVASPATQRVYAVKRDVEKTAGAVQSQRIIILQTPGARSNKCGLGRDVIHSAFSKLNSGDIVRLDLTAASEIKVFRVANCKLVKAFKVGRAVHLGVKLVAAPNDPIVAISGSVGADVYWIENGERIVRFKEREANRLNLDYLDPELFSESGDFLILKALERVKLLAMPKFMISELCRRLNRFPLKFKSGLQQYLERTSTKLIDCRASGKA